MLKNYLTAIISKALNIELWGITHGRWIKPHAWRVDNEQLDKRQR